MTPTPADRPNRKDFRGGFTPEQVEDFKGMTRDERRVAVREARERSDEEELPEGSVPYFRERLYATFTGLAIVRVVESSGHAEPRHAFLALMFGVIGIVIAGTVAEYIAHLIVHRTMAHGSELRIMLNAASGALATMILPLALIGAAWLGWMDLHLALKISATLYIVTLAGIGWLAVRRSTLSFWQRIFVLGGLVALGVLVVLIQQLAKSV